MISIGELSRRTGVKIPTIRYYEQVGLIDAPERSEGNQRRYSQEGLDRLSFIRHARELGMSLEDIRELTALNQSPADACEQAHIITNRHLAFVQARIKKLKKLERELQRFASVSDACHVGECHVIQSLSDHALCEGEH
ncbi:MAG: helix-turn-helix domain-containing protein [Stappiaceae bacterium]